MGDQISVAEAMDRIARETLPLPARSTALATKACGHVLTEAVVAAADTPRLDCSAMDGFAIASGATCGATSANQARFAPAGDIPAETIEGLILLGTSAPISTGAPIPAGADTVVAKEH